MVDVVLMNKLLQAVPPWAMPVACQVSATSGDSQAKPIVPPLQWVAGSLLIGSETEKTPVGERQKTRLPSTNPAGTPSVASSAS